MDKHLKTAAFVANLLDNQFSFFGMRFGLNGLLGLIPGAGDIVTAGLSTYLIVIAFKLNLPLSKIIAMVWNVVLNFIIGLVPVVGDYVDFFTHANLKNLHILQEYVNKDRIIEGEVISSKQ